MNIYQRPAFIRALRKLPEVTQARVRLRARQAAAVFGRPHQHAGIGLRQFGRYFEFRVGLELRCLFLIEAGDMHLVVVGDHRAIASYVRNNG